VSPSPSDPRFEYTDNGPTGLTVAQLDQLAAKVFDPEPEKALGFWGTLVNLAYLVTALAYVFARSKLVETWANYNKQKEEQKQDSQNQSDANAAVPPGVSR